MCQGKVKNRMIVHSKKTLYNKFEFPCFLTLLIDSIDVNIHKKNYIRMRLLFNNLFIINSEIYYIKA